MTTRDDIDGLAGEYVLGTLDMSERASVAARRQREPDLDAAILAWERRLAPLNDTVRDVAPSPGLLKRIEARIAASGVAPNGSAEIVALRGRVNFWRRSAIAASALAASLIMAVGVREMTPQEKPRTLVAVLQKDAQSPAFLVKVDVESRIMTVQPVAAKHEAGKSHELWIIHDSLGKPRSLGVVDDADRLGKRPTLAAYKPDVIADSTYAITLEPEGGSPTGDPTGPVVFSGKLLQSNEF